VATPGDPARRVGTAPATILGDRGRDVQPQGNGHGFMERHDCRSPTAGILRDELKLVPQSSQVKRHLTKLMEYIGWIGCLPLDVADDAERPE